MLSHEAPASPDCRYLAWKIQGIWEVNEVRPVCNDKADLLTDTVGDFLKVWPNGDVYSIEFVAYALVNPPVGGSIIGDELRADIRTEAKLCGLIGSTHFRKN